MVFIGKYQKKICTSEFVNELDMMTDADNFIAIEQDDADVIAGIILFEGPRHFQSAFDRIKNKYGEHLSLIEKVDFEAMPKQSIH